MGAICAWGKATPVSVRVLMGASPYAGVCFPKPCEVGLHSPCSLQLEAWGPRGKAVRGTGNLLLSCPVAQLKHLLLGSPNLPLRTALLPSGALFLPALAFL